MPEPTKPAPQAIADALARIIALPPNAAELMAYWARLGAAQMPAARPRGTPMDNDRLLADVVAHCHDHYESLWRLDAAERLIIHNALRKWLAGVLELIDLAGDRLGVAEIGLWCPVRGCEATIYSPGGANA